ncbi:MAG: hypothetical protein PHI97_33405 [Desulfobulbus sp.]|nr:hypothetical protein [Desulfobulbus sp.]
MIESMLIVPNDITTNYALPDHECTALDGEPDGCDILLQLLQEAPLHMHADSRMYIMAHSLTNISKLFCEIDRNFTCKVIATGSLRAKDFVAKYLSFYLEKMKKEQCFFCNDGE